MATLAPSSESSKASPPRLTVFFAFGIAGGSGFGIMATASRFVPIVAFVYSKLQTPEYTATASLLFSNQSLETSLFNLESSNNTDPTREAATNLRLASLEAVAVRTSEALPAAEMSPGEVREAVSVTPEGESELIGVSATDPSPPFPHIRLDRALDFLIGDRLT